MEARAQIQRDLDKLENWTLGNNMKFNKGKCEVLQMHKYRMGQNGLGSSTAEQDLGVRVEPSLSMSQQCDAVAKKANAIVGCINRGLAQVTGGASIAPLGAG